MFDLPSTPTEADGTGFVGEAIACLHNVSKVYPNGCRGLHSVNLQIRKGDFLFITGPSGAGKSTLLKLLYGAEAPTEGQVEIEGNLFHRLRGRALAHLRRRIGVVFQDYQLIPTKTVEENVAVVLHAQGASRAEIQRRVGPTLRMVGLAPKAACFPDQLSGGEQQRVSIARAVVHTPPLLLADEPTGNLDAHNAWSVLQILKRLHDLGVTVIVTCHNEQLVEAFARRVVRLEAGILRELPVLT
ncbi:cell division ATP-binding protein FtsE [Gloeobacter morelensis]|uniref:Cell division ATP-binding protein FtsE n=1 Tax=Gloeobacter morelensis MG652769 TaxID=2781736 RepID=A0ABY3PI06_9CYAN|nr:cell division ATP-binding protein FtsE [Gloeobacter morelensis]UFP93269.1 cell division ATP-binding protein FtsE [Gloeobacter morelensis MG652769]